MGKKILILSSDLTGHGHKSITESLCEQFGKRQDVTVEVLDGFTLAGNFGFRAGKLYGSITRKSTDLWKVIWHVSTRIAKLINGFTASTVRKKFLDYVSAYKPDLIVSVHPVFVGSVLNILKKENIAIPFVVLLADLVSISNLWLDRRTDYVICPTADSKDICLNYGFSEPQLKLFKLPVRERFVTHYNTYESRKLVEGKTPIFLIMSGGEGVGDMESQARLLLDNFDCRVKIIAGRNAALKDHLEKTLIPEYHDRIEIYPFTENVQDLMLASDIALTRGSPNVMMEAVNCALPLVITGALPGQEAGNPGYALKNNLGVVCNKLSDLKTTIQDLLADGADKLNQIKKAQIEYRDPENAKKIVDFLLDACNKA